MIRQLLLKAVDELRTGFAGVFADPTGQIEMGPISSPDPGERPRIALSLGDLRVSQVVNDDGAGQPRNLEMRQAIPVNGVAPAGPYLLAETPLDGTVAVQAIFDANTVDEYRQELLPMTDFTVDAAGPSVEILADVSLASSLLVTYSYVGIATVREFEQGFSVDYFAMADGQVALHMGLVAAILQTRHSALLDHFNFTAPSSFSGNGFTNLVTLRRINALELVRVETDALSDVRFQWQYNVLGAMRMSHSNAGAFGIISSIHTRGQTGPGVNVLPNLG